jgi:hypothetical protein
MSRCEVQASGSIEAYFYGDASASERAFTERHLRACAECRHALEDLSEIAGALGARGVVDSPPAGDWSGFMTRLEDAVGRDRRRAPGAVAARPLTARPYIAWFAMAALVALVTFSVLFVARTRQDGVRQVQPGQTSALPAVESGAPAAASVFPPATGTSKENDAAFLAMSEKHFERSKLVVLGLATENAREPSGADWAYERQLASSLLTDTRLYRIAAEQRGMTSLARVMGDLELVLLQTSMSEQPDPDTLEQLQRLIRKRDLVTKMEVVTTTGL